MELADLKKGIHASIDEVEDEQTLIEIVQVLEKAENVNQNYPDYESSEAFQKAIDESIKDADNGLLYEHADTIKWLKERAWRTA